MKLHVCFFVLLAGLLSCKDEGTTQSPVPKAKVFEIHLQSWYSGTAVFVSVDQSQVFADTVSTGSVLAVAAIIPLQVTQGIHTLGVNVANSLSKDTTFTISDTLYVGVNYDSGRGIIAYQFQRTPFHYR